MKIKMKTCMTGPEGTVYPDQEIDIDKDKAIELVNGGYAIYLEKPDEELEKEQKEDAVIYPKHIAGGLYLLSDGSKVKGKEAAFEAQKVLDGGAE